MVQKKLKILQISPQFPFPMTDGGKIGIANIYKEYAALGHEVTFCAYTESTVEQIHIQEAEKYGKVILIPHSTRNTPLKIASSLFKAKSLYTSKHLSEAAFNKYKSIIESDYFDIIHCDHSAMMPIALELKKITNIPIALRLHNIEYTIWDRYASVLSNLHPKKWYILNQAKKLREEESHFYHQADVCFAITEADKTRANQLARGANVCVATAGVNLDEWNPLPNISKENALMVLATNYDWIHNVDGAIWFIKEVLPLVIKQYPNAKLQLIGKNPPDALKQLQSNSVEVLGFVPSVKEYLSRANIYVAPLFVGGGIRIKILEAMAMHLPVVATSVSAEGIVAGEADGLFRADSASATSNVIIKLLDDKTLASERGAAAAEFISQNHTWKQCVGIMSDCLLSIVKK